MSAYLKGNVTAKGSVESPGNRAESACDNFEDAALPRFGGSIAYVSRKNFLWQGEDEAEASDGAAKEKA